jgi:DNA-binding GntR family transcriptional regulator
MSKRNPLDHIDPLSRGALRHDVVRRLLALIFQGELPAGTRLVARRLSERLGVSATPIREALVELEQVGMIQLYHNRGAVVKPFGRQELDEIFQVRRVLEAEAARCACGRIGRDDLEAVHREMKALATQPEDEQGRWLRRLLSVDNQLHRLVAKHCGNARLADEIHRYDTLAQVARDVLAGQRPTPKIGMDHHLAIVEGLLADSAEAAAAAMAFHVETVARLLGEVMFGRK